MRRRLLFLVTFSSALLVAILASTVLPLVTSRVTENLDQALRNDILACATYLLADDPTPEQFSRQLSSFNTQKGITLGIAFSTGGVVGTGQFTGITHEDRPYPYTKVSLMSPRFYDDSNGDRVASQGVSNGPHQWVIEGHISAELSHRTQRQIWIRIGLLVLLAVAISIAGAALLSRRITRPIHAAVRGAEAIARGDLGPVDVGRGPEEIVALGVALTAMSAELRALLVRERQRAASLSHSLRTPLTQVALELQRLRRLDPDPTRFSELAASLRLVESSLSDVVTQAQVGTTSVPEVSDAAGVLRQHLEFWEQLAGLQNRANSKQLPPESVWVEMDSKELGICLDSVINNIYRHTPPEADYRVELTADGVEATVTISDNGPGMSARTTEPDPSSSGVGLSAARHAVEAVGGSLTISSPRAGGVTVKIALRQPTRVAASNGRPPPRGPQGSRVLRPNK